MYICSDRTWDFVLFLYLIIYQEKSLQVIEQDNVMSNSVYHRYPPRPTRTGSSPGGSFSTTQNPSMGSSGGSSSAYMTQPIRITEDAVESLVFLLCHSVEFQRSLNAQVKLLDVKSDILGGVTYPVCSNHNETLIKAVGPVVSRVQSLSYNCGSGESAGALFLLRIKVIKQSPQYRFGFMATKVQSIIEEWEFVILKQQNDVLSRKRRTASPQPSSDQQAQSTPSENSAAYMSPDAASQMVFHPDEKLQFCNDGRQIRDVLNYISTKAFDAIDTYLAKDFMNAPEMLYEVSIEEKQGY